MRLSGMLSPHAAQAVFTALTPVAGILHLKIRSGWVDIDHDGRATRTAITDALAVAGYVPEEIIEEGRRLPLL